ncbi:hypothetical protein [Staphylococcus epidermidis]|uniref:hypothetical protein n=1 Tax=Staphylococcus epidermidis TaxID=1282 RepID=UPI0011A29687|nr:hypothetical protein [Staphylococcus epidermidis]
MYGERVGKVRERNGFRRIEILGCDMGGDYEGVERLMGCRGEIVNEKIERVGGLRGRVGGGGS